MQGGRQREQVGEVPVANENCRPSVREQNCSLQLIKCGQVRGNGRQGAVVIGRAVET